MVRKLSPVVVACAIFCLAFGAALAQNQPAAKATAQVIDLNVLGTDSDDYLENFETILVNHVKTSQQKDLFLSVALECGVSTKTVVRSKGGNKDSSTAQAGIQIRVLVDGQEAAPGPVTFCQQKQELSATFQGIIDGCLSIDDLGNVVLDQDCLQPEEVELVMSSMSANSFNFIETDCGVGVHKIEVQARMLFDTDVDAGEVEARATIGKGSLTVEETRMIKGEDVEL